MRKHADGSTLAEARWRKHAGGSMLAEAYIYRSCDLLPHREEVGRVALGFLIR